MAVKTDFSYNNTTLGYLSVDPLQIRGHGGFTAARMFLPLEVLLKPLQRVSRTELSQQYYQHFTLMQVWADMSFRAASGTEFPFSQLASKPLLQESRDWSGTHELWLPVSAASLNHLEKLRTGDVSLTLQLQVLLALHPDSDKPINPGDLGIKKFDRAMHTLNLNIPKSHWVENILPGLGWGKFKLVELRTPEQAISGAYQKTLKAFDQAHHYLNLGDYSQSVSQCRKALESLPSVVKLRFPKGTNPNYPEKVEQFLGKLSLPQTSRDALMAIIKQMWAMTSSPHHTSISYTRADAEFAISVIAAILAYLGDTLNK